MENNCIICGGRIEPHTYLDEQGKEIVYWTIGHNPYPISNKGNCCNKCNTQVVIPTRRKLNGGGANETK